MMEIWIEWEIWFHIREEEFENQKCKELGEGDKIKWVINFYVLNNQELKFLR